MTDRSISQEINEEKLRAKIILMGDGSVGKTTLCCGWIGKESIGYQTTIGADFASKEIIFYFSPTKTNYIIKFQIWDLAGQPRFKAVRDLYYRGAVGALCCFEVTNYESFKNLGEWIKAFWSFNGRGIMPVMIVGTKSDLRGNPAFPSQVTIKIAKIYARELSANVQRKYGFNVYYIETSAKGNLNVDKPFSLLANEIIYNHIFLEKMRKN